MSAAATAPSLRRWNAMVIGFGRYWNKLADYVSERTFMEQILGYDSDCEMLYMQLLKERGW